MSLLVHRIRSGTLPVDYVRRAAALGDPTSIKYVRGRGLEPWPFLTDEPIHYHRPSLSILKGLPQKLLVSFAADVAERVLPIYEGQHPNIRYPISPRPRDAIEAARRWVEDPSDANREDAYAASTFYDDNYAAIAAKEAASIAASEYSIMWELRSDDYHLISSTIPHPDDDHLIRSAIPHYIAAARTAIAAAAARRTIAEPTQREEEQEQEHAWQKQRLIQYLLGEEDL